MQFHPRARSTDLAAFSIALLALIAPACGIAGGADGKEANGAEIRWVPASDAPEKTLSRLALDPQFQAQTVSGDPALVNPSSLAVDPKGRILVIEQKDGMARLRRVDGSLRDDQADHSKVLAEWKSPGESGLSALGDQLWTTDGAHLWMQAGLESGTLGARSEIVSIGIPVGVPVEHGLHPPVMGPDGRLYIPVGDAGAIVKTREGGALNLSEDGGVLRCEPDGNRLEIFCRGLRDPRNLAFDQFGNLFVPDNPSGQGDKARWVYLVEGADFGWRRAWQRFPLGRSRNPWIAEKLWRDGFDGQAAWLLPPAQNIAGRTSGLAFYPGTGMTPIYDGCFFVGSYAGSPVRRGISAWSVISVGGSFQLWTRPMVAAHCAASELAFSADGKVLFTVSGGGLGGSARSRIFEAWNPRGVLAPEIGEARRMLAGGMKYLAPIQLAALLRHKDQRVRLAAEWALAEQPQGEQILFRAASQPGGGDEGRIERLHGIWGMGLRARKAEAAEPGAGVRILTPMIDLLEEPDEEVRAEVVKTLSEFRISTAYDAMVRALRSDSPRVSFYAAQALGRIGRPDCISQILLMARENAGRYPFLRFAYAGALAEFRDPTALEEGMRSGDPAVRLTVLLALRRMERPEIAAFLRDEEPMVALEAARAINDIPIEDALPALASMIEKPVDDVSLMFRALNANFRLGKPSNAGALAALAQREGSPPALRVEALNLLALWPRPPEEDRITGFRRPLAPRDATGATAPLRDALPALFTSPAEGVALAAIQAVEALSMKDEAPQLLDVVKGNAGAGLRCAALQTLAKWDDAKLGEAIASGLADSDLAVRAAAAALLAKHSPKAAAKVLRDVVAHGGIPEKKAALQALGDIPGPAADQALAECFDDFEAGKIPPEAGLEVIEAAAKHPAPEVQKRLGGWMNAAPRGDIPAKLRLALSGGDRVRGQRVFEEDTAAACIRCHRVGDEGGRSGPDLGILGAHLSREAMLECIVAPGGQLAMERRARFITAKNAAVFAGTIETEDADQITLRSPDGPLVSVKKAQIVSSEIVPSGMPADFGKRLGAEKIRDLVEYLARLRPD